MLGDLGFENCASGGDESIVVIEKLTICDWKITRIQLLDAESVKAVGVRSFLIEIEINAAAIDSTIYVHTDSVC